MRKHLASAALFVLPALCAAQTPTPAPAAHHERTAEPLRLKALAGGVYALFGRGGNVGFFVGPDYVLVVDSQFRDLAPGILKQIKKVSALPIRYLINTHHHPDHVGGNEVFRQFATIAAHDNVRKRMLESPAAILRDYPSRLEEARESGNAERAAAFEEQIAWAKKVKVEEIAAPFLTFDSELRIHVPGETIHVWHTPPAHTDGDGVVVFEKAKVVHMGDLLFNEVIPVIDVPGGGSPRGYLDALDRVTARVPGDVTIIPGHGEITDLAGVKKFRQYIVDILEAARMAKAAAKSKEDFVRETELPAYKAYRGYPDRFRSNLGAAYDEAK